MAAGRQQVQISQTGLAEGPLTTKELRVLNQFLGRVVSETEFTDEYEERTIIKYAKYIDNRLKEESTAGRIY